MEFKGRVVVVTGSGKGIGEGIARAFCEEGASVIITSKHLDECIRVATSMGRLKGRAIPIKCDISEIVEVKSLFAQIKKQFGRVDVLVNNAGIYPFAPFEKMTENDWKNVIDVNLNGTFYCTKAALELMTSGSIINISSIAGVRGFASMTHYCSTKGAIDSFTEALALELAPRIRVNAILPGLIITPGTQVLGKQMLNEFAKKIPMKRAGLPSDIANMALFLASEKASFITGQNFIVDGGETVSG